MFKSSGNCRESSVTLEGSMSEIGVTQTQVATEVPPLTFES